MLFRRLGLCFNLYYLGFCLFWFYFFCYLFCLNFLFFFALFVSTKLIFQSLKSIVLNKFLILRILKLKMVLLI